MHIFIQTTNKSILNHSRSSLRSAPRRVAEPRLGPIREVRPVLKIQIWGDFCKNKTGACTPHSSPLLERCAKKFDGALRTNSLYA